MTEKKNKTGSKELLDRYFFAVKKKLPMKNRKDLAREFESLVRDELEDRFGVREEYSREEVLLVINETGAPRKVASRYRGRPFMSIQPELAEFYQFALLFAAGGVTLGLFIAHLVGAINFDGTLREAVKYFLGFIPTLFSALLAMTGAVTITFALIQRYMKVDPSELDIDDDWKPEDLPPVTEEENMVKLWEPVTGLVFISLALIFLNWLVYGDLLTRLVRSDGSCTIIPLVNFTSFRYFAPLWSISLVLAAIQEIILLLRRRRTMGSRLFEITGDFFDMVILIVLIKGPLLIHREALKSLAMINEEGFLGRFAADPDLYLDRLFILLLILTAIGLVSKVVKLIKSRAEA